MDNEEVIALEGSIGKWESIAYGNGRDAGRDNCPCCKLADRRAYEDVCEDDFAYGDGCRKCPIGRIANTYDCFKTPYDDFCTHVRHCEYCEKIGIYCSEARGIAEAEIAFLKRILELVVKESA